MTYLLNTHNQPVGQPINDWTPHPLPSRTVHAGNYCRLEPIDARRHGDDLYAAYADSIGTGDWTYLPIEQPVGRDTFDLYLYGMEKSADPQHYAVIDLTSGKAMGTLALMRIDTGFGTVEVGFVIFSRRLQRTRAATEAHFLLLCYAFDTLGYRRCEWRCDSLNEPSRRAALRLGFTEEGTFRAARVTKGRNQDTTWFSIIDTEWPALRERFTRWLAPSNFDANGNQRLPLGQC